MESDRAVAAQREQCWACSCGICSGQKQQCHDQWLMTLTSLPDLQPLCSWAGQLCCTGTGTCGAELASPHRPCRAVLEGTSHPAPEAALWFLQSPGAEETARKADPNLPPVWIRQQAEGQEGVQHLEHLLLSPFRPSTGKS